MSNISLDRQKKEMPRTHSFGDRTRLHSRGLPRPLSHQTEQQEERGRKASPPAFGKGQTVQGTWSGQLHVSPVCSSVQGWMGLGATCSSGMCPFLPVQSIP